LNSKLIEQLLNSPEYVDFWSFRFGDLLRVTYNTVQDLRMTKAYEDWIVESVAPTSLMIRWPASASRHKCRSRAKFLLHYGDPAARSHHARTGSRVLGPADGVRAMS